MHRETFVIVRAAPEDHHGYAALRMPKHQLTVMAGDRTVRKIRNVRIVERFFDLEPIDSVAKSRTQHDCEFRTKFRLLGEKILG